MSCGRVPDAFVCAVSDRGRGAYGISWGKENDRREGKYMTTKDQGCSCPKAVLLAGILRVLEDAEERNETKMKIAVFPCHISEDLNNPIDQDSFYCCLDLLEKFTKSTVKGEYEGPDVYDCTDFEQAIYEARRAAGSHSLAPWPINDNLFKNGVIGVAIHGEYKMTASGEMKGAFAHFFEDDFIDSVNREMSESFWITRQNNLAYVHIDGLVETLELLLHEQYRQVRIKTSFKPVVDWFKMFENPPEYNNDETWEFYELYTLFLRFRKVEVELDLEDGRQSVLEAKRMVEALFESTVDGLYWKGGVPVVYTDGSLQREGTRAAAGGAAFWGPKNPRNRKCHITGEQTSNRGELGAVVKALETANERHNHKLIIRTDSQSVIDFVAVNLALWKENGWLKSSGEKVKDRDLLEEIDAEMAKMTHISFEKVLAHSGNEGNEGADELAKEAAKEALKELN